jgi:hypothetical protein
MSAEEELPSELKSLEAELAKLVPNADRLKRDRLMFLAGQASVCANGRVNGTAAGFKRRSLWPAAFAVMSTIAASLLAVVLLNWPADIKQTVESPVKSPADGALAANTQTEAVLPDDGTIIASTPPDAGTKRRADQRAAFFAKMFSRGYPSWMQLTGSLNDPRALDRMLDKQYAPAARYSISGQNRENDPGAAAATYRELLETMIDAPEQDKSKTKPPAKKSILSTLFLGADS